MTLKLKSLIGAAVVATTLPFAAAAAPITGQLDLTGNVDQSSVFTSTGSVDFIDGGAAASGAATGDFAALVNTIFEAGADTAFLFTDPLDLSLAGVIYTGGGITFTASSFFGFDNDGDIRGFNALGEITAPGFDPTPGTFSFSTQGVGEFQVSFSATTVPTPVPLPATVFLLLAGLGALGIVSRRCKTVTA